MNAADAELDRVRRSFLFVLEFALGAPFTAAQERLILAQFSPGWWAAKSEDEKEAFGQYPKVVAWIMKRRPERPGGDAQDPRGDDPRLDEGLSAVRPGGRPWSAPAWRSGAGRSSPASRR